MTTYLPAKAPSFLDFRPDSLSVYADWLEEGRADPSFWRQLSSLLSAHPRLSSQMREGARHTPSYWQKRIREHMNDSVLAAYREVGLEGDLCMCWRPAGWGGMPANVASSKALTIRDIWWRPTWQASPLSEMDITTWERKNLAIRLTFGEVTAEYDPAEFAFLLKLYPSAILRCFPDGFARKVMVADDERGRAFVLANLFL